ncbi:SIS domain-containing protein [Sphingomonas canadensis]|uniref:SIS domain-containing protein n=1 Tax=Sphingomonas canadensis TaxID=1219257 RepID=A0ABW3HC16_9SPHN|nr:SIS domain-containing protein [Sphingomonas canadensis]MCW3838114.1 SIS domain-containing protein [Sphingomonas canadensis]
MRHFKILVLRAMACDNDASNHPSLMVTEAAESPERCEAQIAANAELMRDLGARLRKIDPPFVATLARGSSDQAAAFAKAVLETHGGPPTLSHAPSIGSIYGTTSPKFRDVPLIVISQSGRSPDLIAAAEDARRRGAIVIAIVNDVESPLAALSEYVIPVHAGPERSVAATKSFVCTLTAIAHLAAEWTGDPLLLAALNDIGDVLRKAGQADWGAAAPLLAGTRDMLVLGRGLTLSIAGEAALKFKEAAGLHAEAFSIVEVAHGPMTLVGGDDAVLVIGPIDQARAGLADRLADFHRRGSRIIASGMDEDIALADFKLPSATACHPVLSAIASILSFYPLANRIALMRQRDPDRPPHLSKVTRTL